MNRPLKIAFFGSSLLSSYWNGAATYYRGILSAMHALGHEITFYEPDAFDRQSHRDFDVLPCARSVIYGAQGEREVHAALQEAGDADVVVKASGVGVFDELLERAVLELRSDRRLVIFWDVDAPATLERIRDHEADPFRELIPDYDLILTYGGGNPVIEAYRSFGASTCVPIYNALDPSTHFPVSPEPRFEGLLGFLGNRMPDREARVDEFFFRAARALPDRRFLLGGNGWANRVEGSRNIQWLGHIYTGEHNAFNCTPRALLNVSRDSMARFGYSPATRVFEAAGAGACLITDAWKGVGDFLEPGRECLVARDGMEVVAHLADLTEERADEIGRAARERVLREHTYARRAALLDALLADHGAGEAAA